MRLCVSEVEWVGPPTLRRWAYIGVDTADKHLKLARVEHSDPLRLEASERDVSQAH